MRHLLKNVPGFWFVVSGWTNEKPETLMIIGIGIDVIEIARLRAALEHPRTGARFRARVFTAGEVAYCGRRRNPFDSYAVRFVAKEASMKALGRGFGEGIGWHDIEVIRDEGAPRIRLAGSALLRAETLGVRRMHLSLSHSGDVAVAYVVAES